MVQIPYEKPTKCYDCIMYDREHYFCKLSRLEVEEELPEWCEIKEVEP